MRMTRIWTWVLLMAPVVVVAQAWVAARGRVVVGPQFSVLIGVAYFALGLFVAFALDGARASRDRAHELLKAGDADLLTIHVLSRVFGTGRQQDIRSVIDRHLQDQIDFSLADFERSADSYLALFALVRDLQPRTEREQIAYDHMLAVLVSAGERRKQLESLLGQRISSLEWVSLLTMFTVLWAMTVLTSLGSLLAGALGALLIAALAVMLVVLRRMDDLTWQESGSIWGPLHSLFRSLDLVPYYPRAVIESGRATPPAGPARLATYPAPYPDMRGKRIEEVVLVVDGRSGRVRVVARS